ncbi:hypothetical protein CVT25_010082 [Psilocybe cyanescens]|uniref:Uncharacterized protein n=1 Tax=Psilocybe cyanescens TaxID=93625 RepID=A0A409XNU4_PSICY|nr:hypothetical protein CVT25_010082 [Psilocybe cyanescens]
MSTGHSFTSCVGTPVQSLACGLFGGSLCLAHSFTNTPLSPSTPPMQQNSSQTQRSVHTSSRCNLKKIVELYSVEEVEYIAEQVGQEKQAVEAKLSKMILDKVLWLIGLSSTTNLKPTLPPFIFIFSSSLFMPFAYSLPASSPNSKHIVQNTYGVTIGHSSRSPSSWSHYAQKYASFPSPSLWFHQMTMAEAVPLSFH